MFLFYIFVNCLTAIASCDESGGGGGLTTDTHSKRVACIESTRYLTDKREPNTALLDKEIALYYRHDKEKLALLTIYKKEMIVSYYHNRLQLPQSCHSEIDLLVDLITGGVDNSYLFQVEYTNGIIGFSTVQYRRRDLVKRFNPVLKRIMSKMVAQGQTVKTIYERSMPS